MTQQRSEIHSAVILCIRLFIAQQSLSIGVNVVSKRSPSRIFKVLLISLGITILPKSSTLLTIPVAVPDIFVGFEKPSSSVDRCHSLYSLFLPQAAVASLPCYFHISISFYDTFDGRSQTAPTDSTEHFVGANCVRPPTIILQITLQVCKRQEIIPQYLLFDFAMI